MEKCCNIHFCPDMAKKRERWFRVCCLWGAYRVPYSHVPKWKGRKFKKNYPLHNISTKIVCVRDQAWRKRANLVPFSCVHNLVKMVHQLSCDFGYSYQWGADPLYQAMAVWHWHSSFIHCGWCLDLVLTAEATMRNCQKLCQPLLKCPRPGSLCLIEVVTRYGTFGIQSASFYL